MEKNKSAAKYIKKHVAQIHSYSQLTLLQRKIVNVLFAYAFENLLTHQVHKISIKTLCHAIGYNSNDYKLLRDSLKTLMKTVVEWDLLNDCEQEKWLVSTLIASAQMKRGMIEWSYSAHLIRNLVFPSRFGLINIDVVKRFRSTYGLCLYENCVRFRNVKQTPWLDIALFRKLMGIAENKYPIFRDLKRKVISVAVDEVNQHTSLRVHVEYKKSGRTTRAIKFTIEETGVVSADSIHQTDEQRQQDVMVKNLMDFGCDPEQAVKIIADYDLTYVRKKLAAIKSSKSFRNKKIKNPTTYLLCALRDDYLAYQSLGQYEQPIAQDDASTTALADAVAETGFNELMNALEQMDRESRQQLLTVFEGQLQGIYYDQYMKYGLDTWHLRKELFNFVCTNQLLKGDNTIDQAKIKHIEAKALHPATQ